MSNFSNQSEFNYSGRDLEAMSFAHNYHTWIYELISNYLGTKIAEIGSGTGNFTEFLLRNEKTIIDAFEPCYEMHTKNVQFKNHRVTCINENFEHVASSRTNFYDSVVFINVLEHIEDDLKALEMSYEIISKKGHIVIFVPALQYLYSDFDHSIGHFKRYYKNELKNLVQKSGFKVIKCHYFDSVGIIPWFIFMKVMRLSLNHKNTLYYDKLIVPWLKRLEKITTPPIGKNLLLIASK